MEDNDIRYFIEKAKLDTDYYTKGAPLAVRALTLMADNKALVNTHRDIAETRVISKNDGYMLNSTWGLSLYGLRSSIGLAVCGFDYLFQENNLQISHTPQGRVMEYVSQREQKTFNKLRDFRVLMLKDTLLLAGSLKLNNVIATGSTNHFKVKQGFISPQRGLDIIDRPLLEAGFTQDTLGDFIFPLTGSITF